MLSYSIKKNKNRTERGKKVKLSLCSCNIQEQINSKTSEARDKI